mmetsp:Transcript_7808/g.22171  ORF Transcript_7808/g.22171 Transcript_7808/m.22171 type:complete len:210 (+) Transcript_7808:1148-1777(+)
MHPRRGHCVHAAAPERHQVLEGPAHHHGEPEGHRGPRAVPEPRGQEAPRGPRRLLAVGGPVPAVGQEGPQRWHQALRQRQVTRARRGQGATGKGALSSHSHPIDRSRTAEQRHHTQSMAGARPVTAVAITNADRGTVGVAGPLNRTNMQAFPAQGPCQGRPVPPGPSPWARPPGPVTPGPRGGPAPGAAGASARPPAGPAGAWGRWTAR